MFKRQVNVAHIIKCTAVILIMAVATLVIGCSKGYNTPVEGERPQTASAESSSSQPTNGMVQSHDGGSVTIEVEWLGITNDTLVFEVAMNTHSVDLDGYDLMELAVMRDNEGNSHNPVSWDSEAGGHHRRGTLSFPVPTSLEQDSVYYIEIIIREIADIEERILKWELR